MRTAFINELIEQARSNPRIFLVVGIWGFRSSNLLRGNFPTATSTPAWRSRI